MAKNLERLEEGDDGQPSQRTFLVQSDSRKTSNRNPIVEEKVLKIIRSSKIVDQLISRKLRNEYDLARSFRIMQPDMTDKPCLRLDVVGGRAFVDFINEPSSPALSELRPSTLTCCVRVNGQRFRTRPAPCACEPIFADSFFFDLKNRSGMKLLTLCCPVKIAVVKTNANATSKTLLSSVTFDWREILSMENGRAAIALELPHISSGVGQVKFPVGILDLRMQIIIPQHPSWAVTSKSDVICSSREEVDGQLKLEQDERIERNRKFREYAKQWWREYLNIRKGHAHRFVKIFARDFVGDSRMVSLFVERIECCRLLDTAHKALRFVSLIAQCRRSHETESPIGIHSEIQHWKTPSDFLDSGEGCAEDYSILLCCLLIDFGLNVYVSMGTGLKGEHCTWVVTLGSNREVTFWDAFRGNRHSIRPSISESDHDRLHPFQTVDCLFNDRSFHANCQPSNSISGCDFDLSDGRLWKSMSSECIESISVASRSSTTMALMPSDINPNRASQELESTLKSLITNHRRNSKLNTNWNDPLGVILGPGLAAYENEKQTGQGADIRDFLEAVRNAVPEGHTFKGFPLNSSHLDGQRIFQESIRSDVFKDIVSCRGDGIQFAVHAKIHVFPENVISVWTMVAVSYLSIP